MTESANPQFLDVPTLLERSQPRGPGMRMWQAMGVFALVVMFSTYLGSRSSEAAKIVNIVSELLMIGLLGALALISWSVFRKARAEQLQLEGIEELIRLRRWPEAGAMLEQMLGQPTRTPGARVQALIFLAGVLARYNRFDDAIAVQNYLLEHIQLDGGTAHGLRLARAMAMLREDHLFDADRAINELRRQVTRAGRAMDQANAAEENEGDEAKEPTEPQDPQSLSAGLALIEIYRDVKTGHPSEAIEIFDSTLPSLRDQLGHRVADAYVLIAKAHDLLGRDAEAAKMYDNATLLAPAAELHRRYPETAMLSQKYQPAAAPKGAA
jgi:tetratricopeptide (TPR) repeat protein